MLRSVIDYAGCSDALIVPAAVSPFKSECPPADDIHRFNMCRLAVQNYENVSVSDVEFGLPKPSYTINTLEFLIKNNPDTEYIMICGSDALKGIEKWVRFEDIINLVSIGVALRPGADNNNILKLAEYLNKKYGQKIILCPCDAMDVSSSQIRSLIKQNLSISGLVEPEVEEYIIKNKLYKGEF